jgi:hypothetical protein
VACRVQAASTLGTEKKAAYRKMDHCDLVSVRAKGDPLQASLVRRRFYYVTKKGLEFLDSYRKIQSLLTYLEAELETNKPRTPMDYVGVAE